MNTNLRNHLESQTLPQNVIDEIVNMYAWEAGVILSKFEHLDPTIRNIVAQSIHNYNMAMNENRAWFVSYGQAAANDMTYKIRWNM